MVVNRKKTNTEKIILGIDPGTNVMGYGLIKVVGNHASMMGYLLCFIRLFRNRS